ncbi:MAG: maleylpyruvate isomerase N-terminal domain-containing protein, partial [Acidimicrobiales bacterium]|nr:maleylpyruvate isomerase N-terminal domain-containing protein [Acidimicrobiales bacterium]
MDTLAAYTTACAFFGEQLLLVDDDCWDAATPCDGWDVRSLVAHVVLGEAMVVELFNGGQVATAPEVDTSVLGPNPMATWR